jgi:hypothetical protein
MAKSKVVPAYKLEHTNKELDGRLTSLKDQMATREGGVNRSR